jgi:hypothetical protein
MPTSSLRESSRTNLDDSQCDFPRVGHSRADVEHDGGAGGAASVHPARCPRSAVGEHAVVPDPRPAPAPDVGPRDERCVAVGGVGAVLDEEEAVGGAGGDGEAHGGARGRLRGGVRGGEEVRAAGVAEASAVAVKSVHLGHLRVAHPVEHALAFDLRENGETQNHSRGCASLSLFKANTLRYHEVRPEVHEVALPHGRVRVAVLHLPQPPSQDTREANVE